MHADTRPRQALVAQDGNQRGLRPLRSGLVGAEAQLQSAGPDLHKLEGEHAGIVLQHGRHRSGPARRSPEFLARVVGFIVDRTMFRAGEDHRIGPGFYVTVFVCEIVFGLLATLIVMWFGSVALQRALGQGTTVTIYLPQAGAQVQADLRPATAATIPPGLRVLVVEDEADVPAVASNLVAALGCQVATCTTVEEALALLAPHDDVQPFDLLLADIALGPGMCSTELMRRWPALPVVLMSGYSSEVLDEPPASPLLSKPFSQDGRGHAIAHALR